MVKHRNETLRGRHAKRRRLSLSMALIALAAAFGCGEERSADGQPGSAEDRFRAALAEPFGLERTRRLVDSLEGIDSGTAHRLADALAEPGETSPAYERRLLFLLWAELDPDAALDYVSTMRRRAPSRTIVASDVLRRVASENPGKARAWLASLPSGELEAYRVALTVALVEGWPIHEEGHAGITELIQSMPLGFDREGAAHHVVRSLAESGNAEAAMRWAEEIPRHAPGQFRGLAFRKVARVVGRESPRLVSDWLDDHRAHRYGQAGLRVLARTWAAEDPLAALEWATAQPDDRGRFVSLRFAFQQYYEDDREAAIAWLHAQPDEAELDPALLTFALAHVAKEPAVAADAAIRIRDAESREDTLRKVLAQWSVRDGEAARAWMDAQERPNDFWQDLLGPRASSLLPTPEGASTLGERNGGPS